jgi:hypothetical protein
MSTFRPSKVVNEAKEIISELLVTVDTIMNKPQPVLTKEDQLESPATFSFKRDI